MLRILYDDFDQKVKNIHDEMDLHHSYKIKSVYRMLLVQYGYIFIIIFFFLLFSSPKGSENKETKISELGKYISYCTLSRAITITYLPSIHHITSVKHNYRDPERITRDRM